MVATGLAIIASGRLVTRFRDRIDTIGLQFAIASGGGAFAAATGAWLLVVLDTDRAGMSALLGVVFLGGAALIARTAYVIGTEVGDDVDRVINGLMAVGEGDRQVRLSRTGGDQVRSSRRGR